MTRLRSLIKEVLSQESPYYIIQSLKTGSPKYIASVEGEKPSWVPDSRIKQAHKFATLEDAKNYLSKFDTKRTAFWHIYKRPSGDVGLGPDLKESKKDCNCGCNDCGDKAPILTEGKFKSLISEGLQHHIDKKISLFESVYRIGSEKHLELIREARALWIRGIIEVSDDDKGLLETHLGHFGLYEGVEVPLDLPMVNEVEKDINQLKNLSNRKERYNYIKNFSKEKLIDIADELYLDYEEYDDIEDKVLNSFGESLNEEVKIEKSIKDIKAGDVIVVSRNKHFEVDYIDPWSAGGRILVGNEKDVKTGKSQKGKMKVKFLTPRAGDTGLADDTMLTVLKESLNEGFYSSPSDLEDSGLNVIPKDEIHFNKLKDALEVSSLYAEENEATSGRKGYFFFPEEEDGYDQLEMEIQELMDDYNIQGYIEGVFEESLNEGQDKWVVYDTKTKKRLPNAGKIYKDKKAAQAFADKQENAKVASDIYYADNIQESSLKEVDRYSGFIRNPEDPDSEKFEPTGAVAQFKEDLKALFGKFKGDLKNPEFIKGVAEIMVNWKSLLRSQLDEAKKKKKKKKKDPPLNKPERGGSKAYFVYVRDPKTKKIKKVSFGSGGLRAKIKNKEARNSFAARHNCKNKKDRTKAGYWSCNLPRYADQLGLGSKMNTFW